MPMPVQAVWDVGDDTCTVEFDGDLIENEAVDAGNWKMRTGALAGGFDEAAVFGSAVILRGFDGDPSASPAGVDYLPPPFDVFALNDQEISGFTGCPLVVV
jgi:hypothetical protein